MFAAFLSTVLYSFSTVCGTRSARLIGGTEANFWRLAVAGVLLAGWSFGAGVGLEGDAFPLFLLSGIIGIGFGDVASFQAMPRLGARLSSLLTLCFTPPCAAIIEWRWLGTTISAAQAGWIALALAGVGTALTSGEHARHPRKTLVLGILLCAGASAGTALGAVITRKAYVISHAAHQPLDGANAAFQRIVGGLLVAAVCLLIAKRKMFRVQARAPRSMILETSRQKWRGVWKWVLLNAVAGQTLGVSSMQWALETTPTAFVFAIIALTPVLVIPVSWWLDGERPTLRSVAGAMVAVAAIIGLTLSR